MIDQARRDEQLEIVKAIEDSNFNGVALASTGLGKAWVLVECLKRLKPKGRVWYLCDSELNRDETFKKELIKWGASKWIKKIEFYCYQTAYKLSGEQVEFCMADEMDMAITPEYVKSMTKNKFKHLVAVSATLTDEKRKVAEKIRPIVYEIGLQQTEDQGLLNKTRYHFVNFLMSPKESDEYCRYSRSFSVLLADAKKNRYRLEMLKIQRGQFLASLESSARVCRKLIDRLYKDEKARIVVFCGLSKGADKVCAHSYHSKSKNNYLKDFDEGKIRVLSVVGKIDRGANINRINNIILKDPTKSATKFLQRSGRGRRLGADEFLDLYFLIPYFKNQRGQIMPTIVKKWVSDSTSSIDYEPIIFKFNDK